MWRELLFVLLLTATAALAVPQGNCGIVKADQDRDVDQNGNNCNGNGKIVGGCEAARHAWPWMTSLRRSSIFGQWHTCGAELISSKWVLTAAHCVRGSTDPTSYRLHFGRHHIDDYSEGTLQLRQLKRVIMHPAFNPDSSMSNDVALLELQSEVNINEQVSPVCLPKVDVSGDEPAKITGWGKTQGTCCGDWLKQAPVPIQKQETCRRPDILGSQISDTMVCAGPLAGGIDTCQGDSGGPLVYKYKYPNGKQVWQLNGITSWGYGCAEPNKPGVYARVFKFLDWIKQVTDIEPPQ